MKHKAMLTLAVALLLVGVAGVVALSGPSSSPPVSTNLAPPAALGRLIYYTGADATGPIPRAVAGGGLSGLGMMSNVACVDCHGQDGRGGRIGMMFATVDIPDIRYSVLTAARTDDGTTTPAWTDADIARAIRDGVEPDGQHLKAPMPRWAMSDADVSAVIAYLKELSKQ
jgi:mono/diheme cytochrome c family protein